MHRNILHLALLAALAMQTNSENLYISVSPLIRRSRVTYMSAFTATQLLVHLKLIRRLVRVTWTWVDRLISSILITTRRAVMLLLLLLLLGQCLLVVAQVTGGTIIARLCRTTLVQLINYSPSSTHHLL